MSDAKGKSGKPRKFAPKRGGKKPAANDDDSKPANAPGTSAGATADGQADPFSALMAQARQSNSKAAKSAVRVKQEGKLQVAFAAGAAEARGRKGSAAGAGGRGSAGASTSGGGGGGVGFTQAKGYKMLGDAKVEGKGELEDDVALPFLEEDTYYPTLLPFQRVDELHDSEALSRPALPPDLAEQKELPEGNTAEALGITGAAETTVLLQLPPVLPSVTLKEAAESRAAAAAAAVDPGSAWPHAPAAATLSGPEVMHTLPNGRVGAVTVTRKGAVRLKMGCCEYVVMPGVPQHCRQEVHVINVRTGDIVLVAENCKSAVAALDMSRMISEVAAAASRDR